MSDLIYCAAPSRLVHRIEEVMDFVTNQDLAPFHPFQAFPYKRFEGNEKIGRKKSMEYCLRAIEICDKFWMFGVSNGTLEEISHALKISKPVELKLNFDPEWKEFYEKLGAKYNYPLDSLLNLSS